jgi:hypothetical protein
VAISILGEAAVRVRPETTGFKGEAESGILGPLGGVAKAATGLFAAAFAGGAIVKGVQSFYDAAAESAKIGRLTQQVITSTGGAAHVSADQVGDLVTAISNKTGVDDEAIQSGANLLLTFTNIKNAAGKGNDIFTQTTQIMTDMSAALGTDASGSAIQLGKALNDPVKGVSALQKVGVSFTESQKNQIKTLVDSGNVMGAQKIILGELNKEFGGAAAAASTPLDKLKVNLGNVQEAMGAVLIPVADKLATLFTAKLMPAFTDLAGYAQQAFDILFRGDFTGGPWQEDSGVVDALFNIREGFIQLAHNVQAFLASDTFATWVATAQRGAALLWQGLQVLGGFITSVVVPAFMQVASVLAAVAVYFTEHSTAAKILGGVIAAVAALVVAAWVIQAAAAVAGAAASVASWVAVAIGAQVAAEGTSRSTAQIVLGWIASAAAAVFNAAIVVGGWVLMGAQAMLQAARMAAAWLIALGPVGWVIAAVIGLVALIVANWDTVVSATTAAWNAVVGFVVAAWEWIKSAISAAINLLVSWFLNFTLVGLIISHWQQIVDFTRAAWQAVTGAVGAAVDWLVGYVTGLPGRIWAGLAVLGSMLAGLFTAAWAWASAVVGAGVGWVVGWVQALPGRFWAGLQVIGSLLAGIFVGAWNWARDAVAGGVNSVVGFVASLPGRILGVLSGVGSLLINTGRDLIRGLVNGISGAAGFVGDVAGNIWRAIKGFVNSNLIDRLNGLLDFTIAGVHINVPDIPRLHEGGVFTSGTAAGEGLAVLRDNELVVTPEQRATADDLLRALLGGNLGGTTTTTVTGGGVQITNHITQLPGESGAAFAARANADTVWNLNNGVTRRVTTAGGVAP